ncbi:MAG: nucleoside triphosphate pyrophosphohydrolase [Oscillospiraceae bacterium]|nr:nucleoside triphosphate pyrophosphohydrolase [Oscillospiraceae bacterium]
MAKQTVIYNKLVRDRIPQIIEATGQHCTVQVLEKDQYLGKLEEKLCEELNEYQQSKDVEELADLLEVIAATAQARGCSWEKLLQIREEKRQKRGGFQDRILLKEVIKEEAL